MLVVVWISLFPFLTSISLCILSCVVLFLVHIHSTDTIKRSHILDIVSFHLNSDQFQLVSMLYDDSIYLCKLISIVSYGDRIIYGIYIIQGNCIQKL
jgi:hypothetical protein